MFSNFWKYSKSTEIDRNKNSDKLSPEDQLKVTREQVFDGLESGKIFKINQVGYKLKERVIIAAHVSVVQ